MTEKVQDLGLSHISYCLVAAIQVRSALPPQLGGAGGRVRGRRPLVLADRVEDKDSHVVLGAAIGAFEHEGVAGMGGHAHEADGGCVPAHGEFPGVVVAGVVWGPDADVVGAGALEVEGQ